MITDIYLVPHSHTDIGYTHPQPTVLELHRRFLDQALDLCEATAHETDGTAFRWTVEVSGIAENWWEMASDGARERFVAAAQAGQIEVGAMRWNQSQLSDHHMLIEAMRPVRELRAAGVPIRVAMNSDVNGVNWGVVDVMCDFGIEALSMATNEHFGRAVRPRPQAFRWESPSGRSLLVYNGLMYGSTVSGWLGIPTNLEKTREAVPYLTRTLEQRGYPHSVLIMQATNDRIHDNAAPNPALPDHVRRFNAEGGPVRLHLATVSQALDRLRQDDFSQIPTFRGDWPDWWTFGAGGTTRETAVAMAAQRALRDAQQLTAWSSQRLPRQKVLEQRAGDALGFYVEHTFTADRASRKPNSPEVENQINWKKAQAYEALSLARMLRRDGLATLQPHEETAPPAALLYNPLPFPVRRSLRVPDLSVTENIRHPANHFLQRQDVEYSDYPDQQMRMVHVDLPALGYTIGPYGELASDPETVIVSDASLHNAKLRLRLDPRNGGVSSFEVDGIERIDATWGHGFGVPVREAPRPGHRASLFIPPVFTDIASSLDLAEQWQTDWTAVREAGRLQSTRVHQGRGYADVVQCFSFSSDETIEVRYRLAAGENSLAIEVLVDKSRETSPHAYYLPMPLAEDGPWHVHYETAGAIAELDREQLPGSNRHFVTAQRFLRLQGATRGISIATPDLPLFQVGGYSFGRHNNGDVRRDHPVLLAWLNNNYWDVNFEVTQSGPLRTRLQLIAHDAEPVGMSAKRALPYVVEPQLHVLASPVTAQAQLFEVDAGGLIITGMERSENVVQMHVHNPDPFEQELRLASSTLQVVAAAMTGLDGRFLKRLEVRDETVALPVAGRAWVGLRLDEVSKATGR